MTDTKALRARCQSATADEQREVLCPDCGGDGSYPVPHYVSRCCGGSDWECGASGCTGPIEECEWEQEQCHCAAILTAKEANDGIR